MDIVIATNNGDMGGGEVMLLNIARALRTLGHKVTVVGPAQPDELLDAARDEGFTTLALPATDRKTYMAQLRAWRARNRKALLWCNGLVPSLATAGDKNRIVHLHQLPAGSQKVAYRLAKKGARAVLVPSNFMASRIKNATVLENWVSEVSTPINKSKDRSELAVGFFGRVSEIKGTHLLAEALYQLNQKGTLNYRLIIGGKAKFIAKASQNRVKDALHKVESSVTHLGWVTQNEFFQLVDCVVMPSLWEEPFGLVAAESMSARVPLIVSSSGALPEILGSDYPFIVPRGEVQPIIVALENLAHMMEHQDSELSDILSDNYWRWQENYSPDAGKERVRRLLQDFEG